jgi:hypothetical protein
VYAKAGPQAVTDAIHQKLEELNLELKANKAIEMPGLPRNDNDILRDTPPQKRGKRDQGLKRQQKYIEG